MREEARESGDVEPLLALRNGAADEHVLDVFGLDAAALDKAGDDRGEELVRADPRQRALLGEMERRAGISGDDDAFHGLPTFKLSRLRFSICAEELIRR